MRTLSIVCLTSFLLLFLWGVQSTPATAQVQPEVTGNFSVGLPQGGFGDNVTRAGVGGTLMAGLRFQGTPALIGIDFGYMNYGIERRSEPFSTTIPDVRVNVRTTNDIILTHLLLRMQPEDGAVRPHVDGLFGFKYLFTNTRIEDRSSRDPIASSVNFDDFALSFGVGGGFDIRLAQPSPRSDGQPSVRAVYLNLGARYLFGEEAEYLRRGSIERTDDGLVFDVRRSRTDLLTFGLGVTLQF